MRRNGRFNLALGAALAFLVLLLARPVDDHDVRLVANLAQLLAPATTCWWPWPAGSRPACATRTRSPAWAATSSPSCSSRPPATSEVDAVLREADVAMYTAKARGKGRFELATTSL